MQPTPNAPSKHLLDYIDFDLLAGSACCGVIGKIFGNTVSPVIPEPVGFMTFCGANLLAGTLNRRSIAWHKYTDALLLKNKQQLNNALVERFEQLSDRLRQSTLKLTENQKKIVNLEKNIKELNKKPMEKLDQLYREQKEIHESCKTNREEIAALRELLNKSTLVTDQPAPLNQLPTDTAQQKNK
ncbi:hypothetical protein J7438_21730 [Thalassotalea sp. G20_0]|uniref:hypothetical protein n=1 Tax=Thalassotalea sp. G20_0 TaxID=2821093 RepID=UPI001ADD5227|nr:hypothetical protein [Thalassotalea sp. G20_0]MBO9496683.1 hypothetical protein [Thalassotalea sp. G20_0]